MRRLVAAAAVAVLLAACSATDPQVSQGTSVDVVSSDVPADTEPPTTDGGDESDTTEPTDTTEVPSRGDIDWGGCDDDTYAPEVECATLEVPLDYDDESAGTVTLALTRLPAKDDAQGSILINPGGPGGSGNDYLATGLAVDPGQFGDLTESWDFIGFDPRGVGGSKPTIDCVDDTWLDEHEFDDPTPDSPEEQTQLDAAASEFASGCVANTQGIAELDTLNTARDMDRIREAVGDEQLTFYGASYGTFLGAVYATLFPDNVRALVLDGPVYQTGTDFFEADRIQIMGFEQAFGNWATDCQSNTACLFHADDVSARWLALRSALDATPVPGKDGRSANESALVQATQGALYVRSLWSPLSNALAAAESGDGSGLIALADIINERDSDGTWSNLNEAFQVLSCTSGLNGPETDDIEARVAALQTEAPHFGYAARAEDYAKACDGLPTEEPTVVSYTGSGPILIVAGKNDPATPYVWASKMQAALGDASAVLTFTGEGHTALGSSQCVTAQVETVLGDAEQADTSEECAADEPTSAPDWFDDVPEITGITPFPFDDAASLFGFEDGTYVETFVSASERDGAADTVSRGFADAGWDEQGRQDVPVVDDLDATALVESKDGHEIQVFVFGPDLVSSPDFGPIGGLLPSGSSLVLYVVF